MFYKVFNQVLLWGSWLILPVLTEIIRNIRLIIFTIKHSNDTENPLDYFPFVTILIPVYNSSKTLKACLQSIANQSYPVENMEVFLINNGKKDESYKIFQEFQSESSKLKIWWLGSGSGKSKALNKGIYSSNGKYIINIDSDGWLDKNAILNVVKKFEADREINCMTGVVLTDPELIEKTKDKKLKLLQLCEFFEYMEGFLIGRNFQSATNTLYTLAGAFSCFRKEALLKTQLYNSVTLGEDTHMTFQIRKFVGGKVLLCNNAFLYVDPIESLDKLYTQRQRWQRSELQVASLFSEFHSGCFLDIFKKSNMRLLILDHSIAILNLIWTFSMIYFYFIGYPLKYFIISQLFLYSLYTFNSFVYSFISKEFLGKQYKTKRYLKKKRYIVFFMVWYRLINYMIRLAGIINSIGTEAEWNTKTLSYELKQVKEMFKFKKLKQNLKR